MTRYVVLASRRVSGVLWLAFGVIRRSHFVCLPKRSRCCSWNRHCCSFRSCETRSHLIPPFSCAISSHFLMALLRAVTMAYFVVILCSKMPASLAKGVPEKVPSAPGIMARLDFGPTKASCLPQNDSSGVSDFTAIAWAIGECRRYNHTHSWRRSCTASENIVSEFDNMECAGRPSSILSTPISAACTFDVEGQGWAVTYCNMLPDDVGASTEHGLIYEIYGQQDPNCREIESTWYTIANRCLYDDGYWFVTTHNDATGAHMTRQEILSLPVVYSARGVLSALAAAPPFLTRLRCLTMNDNHPQSLIHMLDVKLQIQQLSLHLVWQ